MQVAPGLVVSAIILGLAANAPAMGDGAAGTAPESLALHGAGQAFGLQCPCEIRELSRLMDGGTFFGSIRSANRKTLALYWDRSIASPSPVPRFLTVHRTDVDSSLVLAVGSEEEDAMIELLHACLDSEMSRAVQDSLLLWFDQKATAPRTDGEGPVTRRTLYLIYLLELQRKELEATPVTQE